MVTRNGVIRRGSPHGIAFGSMEEVKCPLGSSCLYQPTL